MRPELISVVVTTYNWPQALDRVLASVARQSWVATEVVIADDGSGPDTAAVIEAWRPRLPFPLLHAWQEDEGFRAGRARNLAARQASGDYLVFTDGDCVLPPTFLDDHARLARRGWYVAGRRACLSASATKDILRGEIDLTVRRARQLGPLFIKPSHARRTARIPLGPLRRLLRANKDLAETCNFAVWTKDFMRVKGFDETYAEFGHEDVDLAIRLSRAGVKGVRGDFAATVMHLDHPRRNFGDVSNQALARVRGGPHVMPARSMFLEAAS